MIRNNLRFVKTSDRNFWSMSLIVVALLIGCLSKAGASPVNLGAAGPGNFTVLSLANKISTSGQSSIGGHAGVVGKGSLNMSESSSIEGRLFLSTKGKFNNSSSVGVLGNVVRDATTDMLLNQAVKDALAASAAAKSLPPTMTVPGGAIKTTMTITGGPFINVLKIKDLDLDAGEIVTLSAPAGGSFVFNVSGKWSLSGGSRILLTGGLTPTDVLYNVMKGADKVDLSGGSEISGILLAPDRDVELKSGVVTGEIIGGEKNITIKETGQVVAPPPLSCSISGRVIDCNGNPLAGVPVALLGPVTTSMSTLADGTYSFNDLHPGAYQVYVPQTWFGEIANPFFQSATVNPVFSICTAVLNFQYICPCSVVGSVVDCDGNALSGVPVTLMTLTGVLTVSTTTNENGTFTFHNLPLGIYFVSVPPVSPSGLVAEPSSDVVILGLDSFNNCVADHQPVFTYCLPDSQ
jgi:choice-of-anchor A domain-containing protein